MLKSRRVNEKAVRGFDGFPHRSGLLLLAAAILMPAAAWAQCPQRAQCPMQEHRG